MRRSSRKIKATNVAKEFWNQSKSKTKGVASLPEDVTIVDTGDGDFKNVMVASVPQDASASIDDSGDAEVVNDMEALSINKAVLKSDSNLCGDNDNCSDNGTLLRDLTRDNGDDDDTSGGNDDEKGDNNCDDIARRVRRKQPCRILLDMVLRALRKKRRIWIAACLGFVLLFLHSRQFSSQKKSHRQHHSEDLPHTHYTIASSQEETHHAKDLPFITNHRTAICFSGQIRTFSKTWLSVKRNFLDHLHHPYDILLIFNNDEEEKEGLSIVQSSKIVGSLPKTTNIYSRIRKDPFIHNDQNNNDIFKKLDLDQWSLLKNHQPVGSTKGYIYQLAGFDSCLNLREELATKKVPHHQPHYYTHAARLRYDTVFESSLPSAVIQSITSPEIQKGMRRLFIPRIQSHDGYNDKFAFGTIDAISQYELQLQHLREEGLPYTNRWCGATNDQQQRILQPEACLKEYLQERKVNVIPIDLQLRILREDGTFSLT